MCSEKWWPLLRTDVTAVKFWNEFILVGLGSWMHVYFRKTFKLVDQFQVFQGQKIHGFCESKCKYNMLIFGGKQFKIWSRKDYDRGLMFCLGKLFECDDWLHAAIWFDEKHVLLLTAHNVVEMWNINGYIATIKRSNECSVLTGGTLLLLKLGVLVLAGTVHGNLLVQWFGETEPLQYLQGHKGVIFSISCIPEREIIVSTSDDRSVRVWRPQPTKKCLSPHTVQYWKETKYVCMHELYGHTARVMRSLIVNDVIVSAGEDSAVCLWHRNGSLMRRTDAAHQGGIWVLEASEGQLLTGGADGVVLMHSIKINILEQGGLVNFGNPKKLLLTARNNIVVLNEAGELILYDPTKAVRKVYTLMHDSTYKMLDISPCHQLIAACDMNGNLDVFVEPCRGESELNNVISKKMQLGKILSMQWADNRNLVLCSDDGTLTVLASKGADVEMVRNHILPASKERWVTAVAMTHPESILIVGDRCGNIHIYAKDQKEPVKTFSKVHGRYGPMSIMVQNEDITTTGRDGTIKTFQITDRELARVKLTCKRDLDFQWVEKFLDKNQSMVCGFHERAFVIYDLKTNRKLVEVACGGGHRAWDAFRAVIKKEVEVIKWTIDGEIFVKEDVFEEVVTLAYVRNSAVRWCFLNLNEIAARCVQIGTHGSEINCLTSFKLPDDGDRVFFISGGEDTTLRISSCRDDKRIFKEELIFKHLSSVRTLRKSVLQPNKILLVSAGGRAQICVKILNFIKIDDEVKIEVEEIVDYMIRGTDKERKGNKTWLECTVDFDPETRIMDVEVLVSNKSCLVFAACSDGCLRIFKLSLSNNEFILITEKKQHKTCILKCHLLKIREKLVLLTCSTRGEIKFLDVTNKEELSSDLINKEELNSDVTHKEELNSNLTNKEELNSDVTNKEEVNSDVTNKEELNSDLTKKELNSDVTNKKELNFLCIQTNKSGINSVDTEVLDDGRILLATGGDDNAIHVKLLELKDQSNLASFTVTSSWTSDQFHSSQITGLCFVNGYLVSTSMDLRITLLKYELLDNRIECKFVSQIIGDIADTQGMHLVEHTSEHIRVCVYGRGLAIRQLAFSC